jgi:hypothetical protein
VSEPTIFDEWAILELMGHRRLGGRVREVQIGGAGFLRIDVPGDGAEVYVTQFYPPSSVYAITPVSEEVARLVARNNRPQPIQRWELPAPKPADDDRDDDDDYDVERRS